MMGSSGEGLLALDEVRSAVEADFSKKGFPPSAGRVLVLAVVIAG